MTVTTGAVEYLPNAEARNYGHIVVQKGALVRVGGEEVFVRELMLTPEHPHVVRPRYKVNAEEPWVRVLGYVQSRNPKANTMGVGIEVKEEPVSPSDLEIVTDALKREPHWARRFDPPFAPWVEPADRHID